MSTILIIDDDEQFNLMMKKALEIKGYNVETAKNGREAKALYQNKTYDVIITDIIMPDVDGYEVILDSRRLGMSDRTIAVTSGRDDIVVRGKDNLNGVVAQQMLEGVDVDDAVLNTVDDDAGDMVARSRRDGA